MDRACLLLETISGRRIVDVEVARTPAEQTLGLMDRYVPPGTGMLFVYDRPREVRMWMANTIVPLDMVFVREGGVVHRVEVCVPAGDRRMVLSRGPVVAVLELSGGETARIGLRPGDRVHAVPWNLSDEVR